MLQCDHQSFGVIMIQPTLPATFPRFLRGDTMALSMASNTAAVEQITHHGPVVQSLTRAPGLHPTQTCLLGGMMSAGPQQMASISWGESPEIMDNGLQIRQKQQHWSNQMVHLPQEDFPCTQRQCKCLLSRLLYQISMFISTEDLYVQFLTGTLWSSSVDSSHVKMYPDTMRLALLRLFQVSLFRRESNHVLVISISKIKWYPIIINLHDKVSE